MSIKHIEGDFKPEHFSKDFGFHGSADTGDGVPEHMAHGGRSRRMHEEHMERRARGGAAEMINDRFAHGGHRVEHPDGRITHHHEDGGHHIVHPDGRVEHHHADGGHMVVHPDGRTIHHHAHGGHTVHHPDGHKVEHHADGGSTHHHIDGTVEHHDSSEYVHRARGGSMGERGVMRGDEAQDKAMIKKAFRQHEDAEHHGEHEELHLRRGGMIGQPSRIPREMRPAAMHDRSPIETPPRNPNVSRTPPNMMPGGEMGYGVQPSDEASAPEPAMARGGHMRHR